MNTLNYYYFSSLLIFFLSFLYLPVYASSVSDQITALEAGLDFEEKTLYTFIEDRKLIDGLQSVCSSESLQTGERFVEKLTAFIERRYADFTDEEMLLDSLDLRNRVHAMHAYMPYGLSDSELCVRKMLMYGLQRELRKRHIEFIGNAGLIDDFNTQNPPLQQIELKERILETLIQQYRTSLSPRITFTVTNPGLLTTLSADEQRIAERARQVMEQAVRFVLASFLKKGWFTQADINQISPVVELEYTKECGSVAGKYEVTYQEDKTGQKSNLRTTRMHLTVSVCSKIGFLLQQMRLSRLIVIHELGHHVWWYKDTDPSRFTKICWGNRGTRNDRCIDRDFVTEYAQTAPEEDYAEHFQQRVIRRRDRSGFVDTKLRYFDTLFRIK